MEKSSVKLDLLDRKILLELDKNCRSPDSAVAKAVGRSRETVKYRIQQLERKGVIDGYITTINPNRFGHRLFKIFLQVENREDERQKLIAYLKTKEQIYWMGLTEGNWDMIFATYAKSHVEFYDIKNDILTRFNHIIIRMATGELVDVRQYLKNFLLPAHFTQVRDWDKTLTWGGVPEADVLEPVEKELLRLLANDARAQVTTLARKLKTTSAIVRNRMRRLEERGIILAYRISVDLGKLGLEFYKAIVYLKQLPPRRLHTLYEYAKGHPKIVYLIRTFTPWEIELELVAESYMEFNAIVREMRSMFPDVIRNYELVLMYWESWFPAQKEMFG